MPTLYLHVGALKTGSSAIQRAFRLGREDLARNGLLFPGEGGRHDDVVSAHHRRPLTLRFNRLEGRTRRERLDDFARGLDALAAEIRARPEHDVLLSSEVLLTEAPRLRLGRLASWARELRERVIVVALVREPAALLHSMAQQQIRNGARRHAEVVAAPEVFDYRKLEAFRSAFGARNMVVRARERLVADGGRLVPAFGGLVGLAPEVAAGLPDPVVNESLSLEALLILDAMRGPRTQAEDALRAERLRTVGRTRFRLPPESVARVEDALAAQRAYLAKRWAIEYAAPAPEAAAEPVWDRDTLAAIGGVLDKLAQENRRLKRALAEAG